MNIKETIKQVLINEVGEANRQSFRYKRNAENSTRYKLSKEKDDFEYLFKTENGFTYRVEIMREMNRQIDPMYQGSAYDTTWEEELAQMYTYDRKKYVNLKKMGVTREDLRTIWFVNFSLADSPKIEDVYTGYTYNTLTRHGDVDLEDESMVPQVHTTIRRTHMSYDDTNAGDFFRVMATVVKIIKNHVEKHGGRMISFRPLDDRRGRVFTSFVMKQVPGSKMWIDNNEFYFLLNI